MLASGWAPNGNLAGNPRIGKVDKNSMFEYIIGPRKNIFHEIYSICVDFILEFQEMTVQKTKKQPKKSAAFGDRLLVLFWGLKQSQFLEVQNKI